MQTLIQDLRFGARMLLKKPSFTLIAVITLALGIGANAAIFSVVNTLLLRPLPFREPGKLVWIANSGNAGLSSVTTRAGNFDDWRKMNQSFEDIGGYFAFFDYVSYTLTGSGEPERLSGVGVTQNFLNLLGVQPLHGRGFDNEESRFGGRQAVILTHNYWLRRFGSDPSVVGRTVTLNDQPATIVGVLPASFDFASTFTPGSRIDMLVPFPIAPETDRWGNTLAVIGRLKPGVTVEQANAEFASLNQQIEKTHPERGGFGSRMSNLQEKVSGQFRKALWVLFGAVSCVLLIACANLANLLLARAASRRKEIAVRVALGANRWRLIRQMLTESILLSLCGAVLGLPLAMFVTQAIASTNAINIPLLHSVEIDGTALAFTVSVAILTGLLFGLVPALQISNTGVNEDLKEAVRGSSEGKRKAWVRKALVISEVAIACILLAGAGLLIRSFMQLLEVDPGFQASHAAAWRIEPGQKYSTDQQRKALYDELTRKVAVIPGVESVGLTDTLPMGRNRTWGIGAKGETYQRGQYPLAFPRIIEGGYIRTMRIPLRSGRDFNDRDDQNSEQVILINEALAKRLWPNRDSIGQMTVINGAERRVVGVVGNVRHSTLEEEAGNEFYIPLKQTNWGGAMELVVRTKIAPESIAPSVRSTFQSVDPNLPAADFKTLDQIVSQSVSPRKFMTVLLGLFSLLALILASLGIYGVISYSVTQRTQEIGIRMALGAMQKDILAMVMKSGMTTALIGVAIGLIGALALTRFISSMLFGVGTTDIPTFASIAILITIVAFLACWIPARRATKVDPMIALRYE